MYFLQGQNRIKGAYKPIETEENKNMIPFDQLKFKMSAENDEQKITVEKLVTHTTITADWPKTQYLPDGLTTSIEINGKPMLEQLYFILGQLISQSEA